MKRKKKKKKRIEERELGKILFRKNKNKMRKKNRDKIKAIETIVKIIGIKSRNWRQRISELQP